MKKRTQIGFTLVEMAIVMFVMALMLGGGLTILSAQQDQQKTEENSAKLNEVREALIGYVIANQRLPCPASSTSNGLETFCTNALGTACGLPIVPPAAIPAHGRCTNPYNGFLPAVTLGLSPTDTQGYAMDSWGTVQSRIRYAVYEGRITGGTANYSTFTASGEMAIATMSNIANFSSNNPLLSVCTNAIGITSTTCNTAIALTSQSPAVIFSLGENAMTGGTSANEAANLNGDPVFISRALTSSAETGGEFDDQVNWLSLYILFNRMVQAGKLP